MPEQSFTDAITESVNAERRKKGLPPIYPGQKQATAQAGTQKLPVDPYSSLAAQAQNTANQNQQAIDQWLIAREQNVQGAREYADAYDRFALTEAQGLNAGYNWALGANTAAGFSNAQGANAAGQALVGNYRDYTGALQASDMAALGGYQQQVSPYFTPIQAGSYTPYQSSAADIAAQQQALGNFNNIMNGGYDIRAAQYASNPADVARQSQSYDQLMGVGNGSLDYQAAHWQSSAEDLGRQNLTYNILMNAAEGGLDYESQGAAAYADAQSLLDQKYALQGLQGAARGDLDQYSQAAGVFTRPDLAQQQQAGISELYGWGIGAHDVTSAAADWARGNGGQAQADPTAVANQRAAVDKFKSLSDPTITAQERFMMELARREQEQTDRASRGAVQADLQARGFGGSGAQLTGMLGAQELTGQQRTLADLAAQANAQARAQVNLQNWATGEGQIRNQSFAEQDANMNRQLSAMGMVDQITNANANRQLTAAGMYVDAMGNLRSQEFDEAFKRAAAGDMMAVENANRRLQAMGMSADQANIMRSQSFDEAYKRGLAADAASANNQQTRLQGAGMAASQANAIRAANDNVGMFNTEQTNVAQANNQTTRLGGMQSAAAQANAIRQANDYVGTFNVGEQNRVSIANQNTRVQGAVGYANQTNAIRTANDAVGTFNAEQSRLQMNFATEQQSREAQRITDLAQQGLTNTMNVNQAGERRAFDSTQFGLLENDRAAGRNDAALTREQQNLGSSYAAGRNLIGDYSAYGQNSYNRALGTAQLGTQIGSTIIGNNQQNFGNQFDVTKLKMSEDAYQRALAAANAPEEKSVLDQALGFVGL